MTSLSHLSFSYLKSISTSLNEELRSCLKRHLFSLHTLMWPERSLFQGNLSPVISPYLFPLKRLCLAVLTECQLPRLCVRSSRIRFSPLRNVTSGHWSIGLPGFISENVIVFHLGRPNFIGSLLWNGPCLGKFMFDISLMINKGICNVEAFQTNMDALWQ
jgi:hypothetical protein